MDKCKSITYGKKEKKQTMEPKDLKTIPRKKKSTRRVNKLKLKKSFEKDKIK